jgi:hypothetical protein
MCVNYSVAIFNIYFAKAQFMYDKLVSSSFINRKEMFVDALINREFCCHHIRSQKVLSGITLTNEKKIVLASFTNRKIALT